MKTIARWEGPTNEAKDDSEVFCGNRECDYQLDDGYDEWKFCPMCGDEIIWHPSGDIGIKRSG